MTFAFEMSRLSVTRHEDITADTAKQVTPGYASNNRNSVLAS